MVDFSKFTDEQLWEIYKSTNVFEWNELLGDKPEGFDNLPKFRLSWWHYLLYRRTKEDYTHPIYLLVQDLMPPDFFEKKKEEHQKAQMNAHWNWHKEHVLSDISNNSMEKRFGKLLFEHMKKQ